MIVYILLPQNPILQDLYTIGFNGKTLGLIIPFIIIINFYTATICQRQTFRCGLQSLTYVQSNVDRGCFFSRWIQCYNVSSARSLLSSHPGGVWLGYDVAHTRQDDGPLPAQWRPFPATTTSNSLQLSSRTGVTITIRPWGTLNS